MPDVTWRAVLIGAACAAAIAVPTALISQAVDSADALGDDTSLLFVFFAVVVAGLAVGGAVAARKRPDAPLTHGILAALVAFSAVQALGVLRRVAVGDDIRWSGIVFSAMVAATAGLAGGLLANRFPAR